MALPLPMKGKRPTRTAWPRSLAAASVSPTEATWGRQYVQAGTLLVSSGCTPPTPRSLYAEHALVAGLVGEPGRPGDIADGIDTRLAGRHPGVGLDVPLLDDDAGALQANVLHVADNTGGEDRAVERGLFRLAVSGLDGRLHRPARDREAVHAGAGVEGHALGLEGLGRGGRDFLVLDRQHTGQELDHGDGAAEIGIEARELHTDGAGADHQQRCRLHGGTIASL